MRFEVKSKGETVRLDRFSLLELLLSKVVDNPRDDFSALSSALSQNLQSKNVLSQFNLDQLIVSGFSLGYYFRVFMEKNDVEIIGEEIELASENNIEPTDENSSS